MGWIRNLISWLARPDPPFIGWKDLNGYTCETHPHETIPAGSWYKLNHWTAKNLYVFRFEKWGKDWKKAAGDVPVVGLAYEGRDRLLCERIQGPNFAVWLEREPENVHDDNAIRVMATAQGWSPSKIGYLAREHAERMAEFDENQGRPIDLSKDLSVIPQSIRLPTKKQAAPYFEIITLERSKAYLNKKAKEEKP